MVGLSVKFNSFSDMCFCDCSVWLLLHPNLAVNQGHMYIDIRLHHARALLTLFYHFSRHNEAKNFKPVTLPGQEAAADYQVKLFALELKNDVLCCMFLK